MTLTPYSPLIVAATLLSLPVIGHAQSDPRFTLGIRTNALLGNGTPSNDVLGNGLFAKFNLNSGWRIGVGYDAYAFDFENSSEVVGIRQPPGQKVIDTKTDSSLLSVWAERDFARTGSVAYFWSAGLGANSLSFDNARGTSDGGANFEIQSESGTEMVVLAGIGARWSLSKAWQLEGGLRLQQHLADWTVRDLNSGNTGNVGNYLLYGLNVGVSYSF